MNANDDLERRIADFYETEAPRRAPDWVLGQALSTIDTTKQRRVLIRVPWRVPPMNSFAKLAVATVVVASVGLVGLAVLRPGSGTGPGGLSGPSPSPITSPSPSPTTAPSPSPTPFIPPALTQPFTSDFHGISISGPAGWSTRKATETWTTSIPFFKSEFADVLYDDSTENLKFIGLASQALAGRSADEWITQVSTDPTWGPLCTPQTEPLTVDGAAGILVAFCPGGLLYALVTTEDRGYIVVLHGVGDRPWFDEILATVQLSPSDAIDVAPSASPASS
jgi:hypothetical protein